VRSTVTGDAPNDRDIATNAASAERTPAIMLSSTGKMAARNTTTSL